MRKAFEPCIPAHGTQVPAGPARNQARWIRPDRPPRRCARATVHPQRKFRTARQEKPAEREPAGLIAIVLRRTARLRPYLTRLLGCFAAEITKADAPSIM